MTFCEANIWGYVRLPYQMVHHITTRGKGLTTKHVLHEMFNNNIWAEKWKVGINIKIVIDIHVYCLHQLSS